MYEKGKPLIQYMKTVCHVPAWGTKINIPLTALDDLVTPSFPLWLAHPAARVLRPSINQSLLNPPQYHAFGPGDGGGGSGHCCCCCCYCFSRYCSPAGNISLFSLSTPLPRHILRVEGWLRLPPDGRLRWLAAAEQAAMATATAAILAVVAGAADAVAAARSSPSLPDTLASSS